jgi:hypothetical protein
MLGSGQVTITIKAINDLSNPSDQFKAIAWTGDFAANGRTTAGVLIAGATSGNYVTILTNGRSKYYMGVAACSFGTALTVTASGYFAAMSAGAHEVGVCMGQDGADNKTPVNCSWAAGLFNFHNKPFANNLASSAGQGAFI